MHIRAMDFEPFAFRINDRALPELVENYAPQERKAGRPQQEPFDARTGTSRSNSTASLWRRHSH